MVPPPIPLPCALVFPPPSRQDANGTRQLASYRGMGENSYCLDLVTVVPKEMSQIWRWSNICIINSALQHKQRTLNIRLSSGTSATKKRSFPQPGIYIDKCTLYIYAVYMHTALWSIWIIAIIHLKQVREMNCEYVFCNRSKRKLVIVKGGPEPFENESNEILSSKREDQFSTPFFELVQKNMSGTCFGAHTAKFPRSARKSCVLRVRHLWFLTSDRLEIWLIPTGTTQSRQSDESHGLMQLASFMVPKSRPPITSKPGSSPPERPGPDHCFWQQGWCARITFQVFCEKWTSLIVILVPHNCPWPEGRVCCFFLSLHA